MLKRRSQTARRFSIALVGAVVLASGDYSAASDIKTTLCERVARNC